MGTQKESFVELTERINGTTGGVSVYPFTSSVKGSPEPVAFLMVCAPLTDGFEIHRGSLKSHPSSSALLLSIHPAAT